MIRGSEKSSSKKLCLYRETLKNTTSCKDITAYKEYRNMYNKTKRRAKFDYYQNKASDFIADSKKLWGLLNQVIGKIKNKGSIIPYITVNCLKIHSATRIADEFGKFYSTLGESMASKIVPGNYDTDHYLSKIPRNLNSLVLAPTSIEEVEKIILKLPSKSSHGHDTISNILLKKLNTSISYPLTHIFNQSIAQGVFLDSMKLTEVIPLCKGKSMDAVENYRPISLLITISKLSYNHA